MEQSNGPQSPGGTPIGSRLIVPAGAAFDPVRRALAAIDAVHGDGNLPQLPVVRTRAASEAGSYDWSDRTGEPLRLHFSGLGEHPELTVVHEIGHFLDHRALGRPGNFASETGDISALMQTIGLSAASDALRALRGRRRDLVWERGRRRVVVVKQSLVEYYLSPREQFARAYAQFIAVSSQATELLVQLEAVQQSRLSAMYHVQWNDGDFRPIRQQFDRLLRRLRWMTSQ